MAASGNSSGGSVFTTRTPILGQKLYVVIIATVVFVLAFFFLAFIFLRRRNSERRRIGVKHGHGLLPLVCGEIGDGDKSDQGQATKVVNDRNKKVLLIDDVVRGLDTESEGKKGSSGSNESSTTRSEASSASTSDGLGNFGWGRWYSLRELEIATNQFSGDNVIGEGGYGVVYRGVLSDGSVVAVKNLLNKK